jgi:hypothetical protein
MTACCWAYATSFPHAYNPVIKRQDAGGTHYYAWQPRSDGKLAFYYTDNGGAGKQYDPGVITLSANTWYHLLFTISTKGTGYINGAVDQVTTTGAGIAAITANTQLGADFPSTTGWAGRLADAAIWNTVLSSTEITALANGARPNTIRSGNLVGWWPLDGLQSPEPDLSGNANNGTLTGTSSAFGPPFAPITPRWPMMVPLAAVPSPFTLMPQIVT